MVIVQQKNKKCKIVSVTENLKLDESRNMALLKFRGPNAGARVISDFFSFYVLVGCGTVFDDEITAIRTALFQLQCHLEQFTRAVVFSDITAALLAIVSDSNPIIQNVLDCRHGLKNLASLGKTIVLQWVPAYCEVPAVFPMSWRNVILNLRNGSRRRAVAEFSLATGHDYL
ncbi:hypothetical protein TNCV_3659351 [Trichonephila clavipes]|nr:hypothetical protein TNCV_3659351 [Trichonephila clavipes]